MQKMENEIMVFLAAFAAAHDNNSAAQPQQDFLAAFAAAH